MALCQRAITLRLSGLAYQPCQLRPDLVHFGFDRRLRIVAQRKVMAIGLNRAFAVAHQLRKVAFLPKTIRDVHCSTVSHAPPHCPERPADIPLSLAPSYDRHDPARPSLACEQECVKLTEGSV